MPIKSARKLGADLALSMGLCIACWKRKIYTEHSSKYCSYCFSLRKQANTKSRKAHWSPPAPRQLLSESEKREHDKRYRDAHKSEARKRSVDWLKNNLEKYSKYQKEWRQSNKDKSIAYTNKLHRQYSASVWEL